MVNIDQLVVKGSAIVWHFFRRDSGWNYRQHSWILNLETRL